MCISVKTYGHWYNSNIKCNITYNESLSYDIFACIQLA